MKKNLSFPRTARVTLATLFLLSGIALFCAVPLVGLHAQNGRIQKRSRPPSATPDALPSSGSVGPSPGGPSATWQGQATAPGGGVNTEASCVEGVNCETFTLTVNGTQAAWTGQKVQVLLTWGSSANEYDIYIHQGPNTNTMGADSGPLVTSAMAGPGLTNQIANIDVGTFGTGIFTVHVVYDTTPNVIDHYTGSATAVPITPVPPPPAPQDTGSKVGYENFEAPGVLTPITSTSSGGLTVEYMGRGAGEPSVGSNWNTGVANIQSDLETLFVTFDDNCPASGATSMWVNRRAPTSQVVDSDPIGFTDRTTSRVFAAELTLLSPDTVKISHSDDDGVTWVPDQSGGIASAVDHETIGGGPYHLINGLAPPHSATYANAVYYCSQDIAAALCSRSDDGGSTYGPSVPIYNLTACGGLHGHVKVSPVDGTVFVPNRQCGSAQALVVSQDDGMTWTIRPVQNGGTTAAPGTIGTGDDPAVGVDGNGRIYFAFSNAGTAASVATSDDFGVTWNNIFDVGAIYGLNNAAFAAAVGGSGGRAAVAYYGANSGTGDSNSGSFTGAWHLYVAHTFDGGAHWTTSDVTPNLPMQRSGILRGGGADIVRNLLDFFDITIDRDGRVLVGYVNGCSGGNCAQAASTAHGNTYSATATIARQSSGRRMLSGKDPASTTSKPGIPFLTQRRVGGVVHLAWNESDTGNLMINNYQILRGTASGAESLLATISGSQTGGTYDDATATDITKTYYYKVIAINSAGSSCGNNEVAAPYVGDTCTGTIIHKNDPSHPEATGGSASAPPTPELLIDYIAVGEPPAMPGTLMFKMKVGDLSTIPPNSRWRIAWNWWSPTNQMYYVGMTADQTGTVTFEYGTLADAGVPAVLVLGETKIADIVQSPTGTHFDPDGTITMFVPKSAVGNPTAGDLLGAVGGKTITGDTPTTNTFERSTSFVDHTFVKGQADNAYPPATYTLAGNVSCSLGGIVPVGAVSRKTHGNNAGDHDVDLPLTGGLGVECRNRGGSSDPQVDHKVVIIFSAPVTVTSATATPGAGKTASVLGTPTVNGSVVTVNLTNVSDGQKLLINLLGVHQGANTADISIPMGVLIGDTNGDSSVDGTDVSQTKSQSGNSAANGLVFREDINLDGFVDGTDVSFVKSRSGGHISP
ncbi:MAG: hypothetical protein QOG67_1023 [Verrucomicrobiota bacterium]|jgi:hypothetical protein